MTGTRKVTSEPEEGKDFQTVKTLTYRIRELERLIAKMCHYSGSTRLLEEFGIKPWVPGEKDTRRQYKET